MTWMRLYYFIILNWDKGFTIKAFCIPRDKNLEYTILLAIDIYRMGINNLNIKLVI